MNGVSDQPANQRQTYPARFVFPLDREPLEEATLEIENGRIAGLHTLHDPQAVDLGNVAVIPGLVNAHTHLEFSDLDAPLPATDQFTHWIRAVVGHRRSPTFDPQTAITCGIEESKQQGISTLGEIATADMNYEQLVTSHAPRTVLFREAIGLTNEAITQQLDFARQFLDETSQDTANVRRALSPHAPYSVHPQLFRGLVDLAVEHDISIAMHLAETPSEIELLERGTGEFVDLLTDFGLWRSDLFEQGTRPLDYLRPLAETMSALIIHGNYLSDEELDFVARHPQLTVVYCPRTHAYFDHAPHPWRKLIERGGNVALGTDSRASNPDLSLWNELLFLRRQFPEVDPRTLLRMATVNGAAALRFPNSTGQPFNMGAPADLTVVALPKQTSGDAFAQLFHPDSHVTGGMRDGQWGQAPENITH
jgi:cytosine/adenosine deaminase-related metal-dependent hydrolase